MSFNSAPTDPHLFIDNSLSNSTITINNDPLIDNSNASSASSTTKPANNDFIRKHLSIQQPKEQGITKHVIQQIQHRQIIRERQQIMQKIRAVLLKKIIKNLIMLTIFKIYNQKLKYWIKNKKNY